MRQWSSVLAWVFFFFLITAGNVLSVQLNEISSFATKGTMPRGLAFDGQYLWNVEWGEEVIYKTENGDDWPSSVPISGFWAQGLAFGNGMLWVADVRATRIVAVDPATGNKNTEFAAPGDKPSGLAFDGVYLWNADYGDDKIYQLELSGNIIKSFASPGSNPKGLAFDGTYLWNADSDTDKIYKLDLSGNVISTFDAPGSNPQGLTSDGAYIWNADDTEDRVYQLAPSVEQGDLNGDGVVDLTDAILALQSVSGITSSGVNILADVNGDGRLGVEEAIYILRKVSE